MLIPRTDRNVAGGEAWLAHVRDDGGRSRARRVSLPAHHARCWTWRRPMSEDVRAARRWAGVLVPPSNPCDRAGARALPGRRDDALRLALSRHARHDARAAQPPLPRAVSRSVSERSASSRCRPSSIGLTGPSYRLLPEGDRALDARAHGHRRRAGHHGERRDRRRARRAARAPHLRSCRRIRNGSPTRRRPIGAAPGTTSRRS